MSKPTMGDLEALDLRIGTVVKCENNEGARDPAFRLWIDVGDGTRVQSSAKVTDLYSAHDLVGVQVVVVAGFEPMRVGGFRSDVLVLGALTPEGVVLLTPQRDVAPGSSVA